MSIPWGAKSWRGFDGEDDMTEEDWKQRALDQGLAMLEAQPWQNSSLDEDGIPTGGCYNGDYPQAWHDECNRRLEGDEYYEAQVEQQVRDLYHNQQDS